MQHNWFFTACLSSLSLNYDIVYYTDVLHFYFILSLIYFLKASKSY